MSVITGLVICSSVCEPDGSLGEDGPPLWFEKVNDWIRNKSPTFSLKMLDDHCGGNKHPQMFIAGGGLNYFPEDDFLEWFGSLEWEIPENVVLLMDPEVGETLVWRPQIKRPGGEK